MPHVSIIAVVAGTIAPSLHPPTHPTSIHLNPPTHPPTSTQCLVPPSY